MVKRKRLIGMKLALDGKRREHPESYIRTCEVRGGELSGTLSHFQKYSVLLGFVTLMGLNKIVPISECNNNR